MSNQLINRPPKLVTIVTQSIRKSIVEGELPLGEYIAEERIAATLGVSRTPVREALMSLQFQGLVETAPPRGAYVFKPSYDEVVKLSEFRMFMELQALTLAAGNQLQKLLTDLRRATAAMRTAAAVSYTHLTLPTKA